MNIRITEELVISCNIFFYWQIFFCKRICEGTIVCVRKSSHVIHPSPFYLVRLNGNINAVENTEVKATYFAQDLLLPFQYVETTVIGGIKATSILSSFANYKKRDDTIVLDDDVN